jgi:hypothetical protein
MGLAFLLASCKGQTSTVPGPSSNAPTWVNTGEIAVSGASEDDVLTQMSEALHEHKYPLFVAVSLHGHAHFFPSNAQVVRTRNSVAVRAFARVYVFPERGVRVIASVLPGEAVAAIKSLPFVSEPAFDTAVRHQATGSAVSSRSICAECAMLITSRAAVLRYTEDWHSAIDRWRPITSHPVAIRPDLTSCPQDQAGGGSCGSSGGSGGGGSSIGGGGGGGGSGGGSSYTTPKPKYTPFPPELLECWNAAVSSHSFWINYCAENYSGYAYISCMAETLESTQNKINWCVLYNS